MKTSALYCLVAVVLGGSARAGGPGEIEVETPAARSEWQFRASPYGWLTGLDGSTGVGGLRSDLDASFFGDVVDDLKMAAALQLEARNGKWGILADGFYADLGASGPAPGPIYEEVSIDLKEFIGELSIAYRVYGSPSGFVDLYAGIRYNDLSLDFTGTSEPAGIAALSVNAIDRVTEILEHRADEIAGDNLAAFQAASAAKRTDIAAKVTATIEAEADDRVKRDLAKELLKIRRDGGLTRRDLAAAKINVAVKRQRLQLARSTARLAVAELRASVDASLQAGVANARSKVERAEARLATALDKQLTRNVPIEVSAAKDWLDPIAGVRGRWNFNDRFFLAGKSDIGGFGAGSDLAWTVQATVGYSFTSNVSAELGYRYLHTAYSDGLFSYDVAQSGLFTSLNIHF